jgi:hypothetical protein
MSYLLVICIGGILLGSHFLKVNLLLNVENILGLVDIELATYSEQLLARKVEFVYLDPTSRR